MLAPNLLLCEGEDDQDVLLHLLGRHSFRRLPLLEEAGSGYLLISPGNQHLQLRRAGGYDSLRTNLRLFLHPRLERIGIVIDADAEVDSRWQSLKDLVAAQGYTQGLEQRRDNGIVLKAQNLPVLGAWVMPDNVKGGALEQFLLDIMPPDDALWPLACNAVSAIPEEIRRFKIHQTRKAELRTWLAWQEDPGIPLGLPITRRRLNPNALPAARLVAWLKRLLNTKV